jgi:hypothetical protein
MIRLVAALIMVGAAAQAREDPLFGVWCGAGQTLYIDAAGISADEITFCDADPLPHSDNGRYSARITCRNVYVTGGTPGGATDPLQINEVLIPDLVSIDTRLERADRLLVTFSGAAAHAFDRCG